MVTNAPSMAPGSSAHPALGSIAWLRAGARELLRDWFALITRTVLGVPLAILASAIRRVVRSAMPW